MAGSMRLVALIYGRMAGSTRLVVPNTRVYTTLES